MSDKIKKIIMYVTGGIMAFAVFMFLMDCIKWNGKGISPETYVPAFFDVMFGINGSPSGFDFVICPGMLVLFILQIIVSLGVAITIVLFLTKKIDTKKAYLCFSIVGMLAIVCAVLSFCSPLLINKVMLTKEMPEIGKSSGELVSVKGMSDLAWGGIVYGSVMAACGLGALVPYISTYCLKK